MPQPPMRPPPLAGGRKQARGPFSAVAAAGRFSNFADGSEGIGKRRVSPPLTLGGPLVQEPHAAHSQRRDLPVSMSCASNTTTDRA
jgi:hypothetical protein